MAWTTADDVLDAWIGDDAPSDSDLIDLWIGKAEREIRFRVPDLQVRIDAEAELDPPSTALLEDAIDVVVAMVTRKFRNPEGIRQRNVTTGPFSEQQTYGGETPGDLSMLPSEVDKLAGSTGSGTQAFSINLVPTSSRFHPDYEYSDYWWPYL